MPDKAWKQFERRVAEFFSLRRNPLSGANSKHSASDAIPMEGDPFPPKLFIECKWRGADKEAAGMVLLRETRKLAKKEGKIAVCVFGNFHKPGFGILIHSDDLDRFLTEAYIARAKGLDHEPESEHHLDHQALPLGSEPI